MASYSWSASATSSGSYGGTYIKSVAYMPHTVPYIKGTIRLNQLQCFFNHKTQPHSEAT